MQKWHLLLVIETITGPADLWTSVRSVVIISDGLWVLANFSSLSFCPYIYWYSQIYTTFVCVFCTVYGVLCVYMCLCVCETLLVNSPHKQPVISALQNGFEYMAQHSMGLWYQSLSVFAPQYMWLKCRPAHSMTTTSPTTTLPYFVKHAFTPCYPPQIRVPAYKDKWKSKQLHVMCVRTHIFIYLFFLLIPMHLTNMFCYLCVELNELNI